MLSNYTCYSYCSALHVAHICGASRGLVAWKPRNLWGYVRDTVNNAQASTAYLLQARCVTYVQVDMADARGKQLHA